MRVYERLYAAYGPQHWWPGETPFEVIIGAILTQSVAWTSVEKAIVALKREGLLSAPALRAVSHERLAALLRPTGYFNAKARKVQAMAQHLARYDDDLDRFFHQPMEALRKELLAIHGVGEETADSIVLYAAGKPSFVIDAYTRRIFGRLRMGPADGAYARFRAWFQRHLPAEPRLFNEYHALLVWLGKDVCRKQRPRCGVCPLQDDCPTGRASPLKLESR
jgi:endonuclease-3 related protein